jgi:hypothetical protein
VDEVPRAREHEEAAVKNPSQQEEKMHTASTGIAYSGVRRDPPRP